MGSLLRSLGLLLWTFLSTHLVVRAAYVPLRQYAGPTFFDAWDYYGFYDNTTWGNVTYVDRQTATTSRLTYINNAGNAVLRVDNVTNVQDGPLVYRNSVRITSKDAYGFGSLIMIDVRHIPYGCSVWPSFWTLGAGKEWPQGGEIDVIEGINMMNNNQIALHTTGGCFQDANPGQTSATLETDCSTPKGCIVAEKQPNSWGPGFAQAGGGVWALQIDVAGIFVWYWSRPSVPMNIRTATGDSIIDTASWGLPSASYPSTACNVTQFFTPQQLVLLTTLCGVWAGVPSIYASTCPGSCFANNVVGPGSPKYDNAFWEISWIRTYNFNAATPPTPDGLVQNSTSPPAQGPASQPLPSTILGITSVAGPTPSSNVLPSAALSVKYSLSKSQLVLVYALMACLLVCL